MNREGVSIGESNIKSDNKGEIACDLCGEKSDTYRGCWFGKKQRSICPKCLSQFKVYKKIVQEEYVVLEDRHE